MKKLMILGLITILSIFPFSQVQAKTTSGSPSITLYRENGSVYQELRNGSGTSFSQDVTVVLFTIPGCGNTGRVMRDVCDLNKKGSSVKVILAYTDNVSATTVNSMRQSYPDADIIPYNGNNAVTASTLAGGGYTTPFVAVIPNKNNSSKTVTDVFAGAESGIRAGIRQYTGGKDVVDVNGISMTYAGDVINLKSATVTKKYTATVTPANATYKGITFTSDDPSVASVDGNGLVTAHKTGTTRIWATTYDGGYSSSAPLKVVSDYIYVSYLDMDTYYPIEMNAGTTKNLAFFVSPSNATDRSVVITSSNPAVATVTNSGLITAKSAGQTLITVTTNGTTSAGQPLSKSVTVKVSGTGGGTTTGGAGWKKTGGKWWYQNADGSYPKNAWKKIDGKWYRFDASGYMVTGWKKISKKWYYLGNDGAMRTGWQKISKKWYYFESSGAMVTGWKKLSGKWYYFESSGVMLAGMSKKIGGKTYRFNASGVCTNP